MKVTINIDRKEVETALKKMIVDAIGEQTKKILDKQDHLQLIKESIKENLDNYRITDLERYLNQIFEYESDKDANM